MFDRYRGGAIFVALSLGNGLLSIKGDYGAIETKGR